MTRDETPPGAMGANPMMHAGEILLSLPNGGALGRGPRVAQEAFPEFRLEAYFSRWEASARYHLTASDAESLSLSELLAYASPQQRAAFECLRLGYTAPEGARDLREAIASTYVSLAADDVLCFAGAGEGLFVAMQALLGGGDHSIVVTPNYQAAETLPAAIGEVSGIALDADHDWSLDIDRLAACIRPNTRLVSINFPHNPSGKILEADRFEALIRLCRYYGLWLFSDEVYHDLGPVGGRHLPHAADVYERGLSLGAMSKAYGLPGLRIGWVACADRAVLAKMERIKHYLSVCNVGLAERLALIALGARAPIIARNRAIISVNLDLLDMFFARHSNLFAWRRPDGGCVCYPRYLGADGVETFATRLIEQAGVLLLPASVFQSRLTSPSADRFRIGAGRRGMAEALVAFDNAIVTAPPPGRADPV